MTREERDEKEFGKIFEENREYWNNIPGRQDLAKHFFMESRKLLRKRIAEQSEKEEWDKGVSYSPDFVTPSQKLREKEKIDG
ncbi:MAG: hypothetical protein IMZ43_09535 [Thermoplasmata archaeon]|nr:hypothetical protein [Thermoplasmata archaeon]